MTENERIIDAFRNCISEPKCKDCPWDECDTLNNGCVEIPRDLALAVMRMLTEHEPVEPELDVDEWRCGKCGHPLEHQEMLGSNILFHEQYAYCPNCGRKVKYDDR